MPETSRSAQPAATQGGGGPWFTHKYGPLPLWLWLALILGALLLITEYRAKKAAKTSATTSADTSSTVPNNSSGVVVVDVDEMPYPVPTTGTTGPPVHGGKPPVKTPGGPVIKPPTPTPKPPVNTRPPSGGNTPPPQRTQKVGTWPNWDGSLWGIAQHYYGNGADWPKIYNANKSVIGSNPNLIKPGMVLVIP